MLYVLATEGAQDTNLGDRFQYNVALSYRLTGALSGPAGLPAPMYHGGPKAHHGHKHAHEEAAPPKGPALDLVLELNGEWHDRQRIAGATDANSGGNVVFLSPGLRLSYDKWSGFVSFGVPVASELQRPAGRARLARVDRHVHQLLGFTNQACPAPGPEPLRLGPCVGLRGILQCSDPCFSLWPRRR